MSENAPVSVIIPAYNVETSLPRAVLSALEQVPPPLEVIVINDGSTDRTAEVAHGFDELIRYLEQQNQGPAAARNAGLAVATGKYVAFLDADDYWLPGFIKATVEFMEENPDAVAVSTGWQYQTVKGDVKVFSVDDDIKGINCQACVLKNFFDFWGRHDHVRTGTVLLRRSKLGNYGLQRAELRICEDIEFWAYIATLGNWGFIPQVYWFGDSARVAAKAGWMARYRLRRKFCPTMDAWQERIMPKLKDADWPGFRMVRGRVALIFAHNMLLAGRFKDARKIVASYKNELPKSWSARLLKTGHQSRLFFWCAVCSLFWLREHQKNFMLTHKIGLKD